MLEPMSEEKMFIKKLDLGVQDFPVEWAEGQEQYVTGTQSDGCGGRYNTYGWRATGVLLYDERVKVFSDILKTAYPQIMKASWNYLNTDEMLNLKMKSQEIREKAVLTPLAISKMIPYIIIGGLEISTWRLFVLTSVVICWIFFLIRSKTSVILFIQSFLGSCLDCQLARLAAIFQ